MKTKIILRKTGMGLMVALMTVFLLPSGGISLAQTNSPNIDLVLPDPASPQLHSGAPNVIRVDATSASSAIQTVESQLRKPVTTTNLDALEIFVQEVPVLTPRATGVTNDTTLFPTEIPAGTTILFIIEGVVTSINAATGEWQIGDQPVIGYESTATAINSAPVQGDLVRIVGHRTLEPGPIVAERISRLARAPQPSGPATVTTAFWFHGTVTAAGATSWTVTPPTPASPISFNILLDAGPLGLGPTFIEFGLDTGSAVTTEFALVGTPGGGTSPVIGAHEIFVQIPLPNVTPVADNPVFDYTPPLSLQAPAGSVVSFEIEGVVSAVNPTSGEWQIGTQPIFVYENAVTARRGFAVDPAVGDEVRIIASRTAAPGPIVAEDIEFRNSGRPQGVALIISTIDAFLFNGTVSAITQTQWTISPPMVHCVWPTIRWG